MNMKELASKIAAREGKKVEVSIGNIREILKIVVDMEVESGSPEDSPLTCLVKRSIAVQKKSKQASSKIPKSKKKSA